MKSRHCVTAGLLAALLVLFAGSSRAAPEVMEMAITVDDLPAHGALPDDTTRAQIAQRFISALKASGVPSVYGFINARRLKDDPATAEVLRLWIDAGFLLGNHTYTHSDLSTSDAQAFEKDIADDEPALESLMGSRDWHWFRYPFMHDGDTLEKRRTVRAYLDEHGYKIAQVTLDFQDYAWNDPYARCVKAGDTESIAWLKASYVSAASEDISLGQKLAFMLYGRNIKHVLLLHVGAFDSVMLPELLDRLTHQNVRFVSLQQAEADPAYQLEPEPSPPAGGTMLERWIQVRRMPYPPHTGKPFEKLSSLCR
jgi:peptidoglycan/xylan/chitin deacetylase (PgdA/CDA1 family)